MPVLLWARLLSDSPSAVGFRRVLSLHLSRDQVLGLDLNCSEQSFWIGAWSRRPQGPVLRWCAPARPLWPPERISPESSTPL